MSELSIFGDILLITKEFSADCRCSRRIFSGSSMLDEPLSIWVYGLVTKGVAFAGIYYVEALPSFKPGITGLKPGAVPGLRLSLGTSIGFC